MLVCHKSGKSGRLHQNPHFTISDVASLFTKISKFHHENPQFLQHPIKFAIVDPSKASDCTTKVSIEATGRIFVGARSKHAFKSQND